MKHHFQISISILFLLCSAIELTASNFTISNDTIYIGSLSKNETAQIEVIKGEELYVVLTEVNKKPSKFFKAFSADKPKVLIEESWEAKKKQSEIPVHELLSGNEKVGDKVLIEFKDPDGNLLNSKVSVKIIKKETLALPEAPELDLLDWDAISKSSVCSFDTISYFSEFYELVYDPGGCWSTAENSLYQRRSFKESKKVNIELEESEIYVIQGDTGKLEEMLEYRPKKFCAPIHKPFSFSVINPNPIRYAIDISSETQSDSQNIPLLILSGIESYLGKFIKGGAVTLQQPSSLKALAYLLRIAEDFELFIQTYSTRDCTPGLISERDKLLSNARDVLAKDCDLNVPIPILAKHFIASLDTGEAKQSAIIINLHQMIRNYKLLQSLVVSSTHRVPQVPNVDRIIFYPTINNGADAEFPASLTIMEDGGISIPVKGGFKIGGSVGLYYSSLRNDIDYSTTTDSVQTISNGSISYQSGTRILSAENGGIAGAMALVHFSYRSLSPVNISFSAGVGVPFTREPIPEVLLGSSLIFGRDHNFNISGGLSLGLVDELKPQFDRTSIYTATEGFTRKAIQAGWFIGFSYTIQPRMSKRSRSLGTPAVANADPVKDKDKKESD